MESGKVSKRANVSPKEISVNAIQGLLRVLWRQRKLPGSDYLPPLALPFAHFKTGGGSEEPNIVGTGLNSPLKVAGVFFRNAEIEARPSFCSHEEKRDLEK